MEDIVHNNTDEIVCPYCSYYINNSVGYESEEDSVDCPSCGRKFRYRRYTFMLYDSWIENE